MVCLPVCGSNAASSGTGRGTATSSKAAANTSRARSPPRARATRPPHDAAVTPRPTQPGQCPKAPATAKSTVAPACHTMCSSGSSAVNHPAKKLPTLSGSRRTGRKAFTTKAAPTRLAAR